MLLPRRHPDSRTKKRLHALAEPFPTPTTIDAPAFVPGNTPDRSISGGKQDNPPSTYSPRKDAGGSGTNPIQRIIAPITPTITSYLLTHFHSHSGRRSTRRALRDIETISSRTLAPIEYPRSVTGRDPTGRDNKTAARSLPASSALLLTTPHGSSCHRPTPHEDGRPPCSRSTFLTHFR